MKTIPVLDLAGVGLDKTDEEIDEAIEGRLASELSAALSSVGFAYLKNHGIGQQLVSRVFEISAKFFNLPDEVKRQYKRVPDNNGYVIPGQEILQEKSKKEFREAYDVFTPEGKFPDAEVPEMRETIREIYNEYHKLLKRLFVILALSLGQDRNFFLEQHKYIGQGPDKNPTGMRTLYYPPVDEDQIQVGNERCGEHSDYGTVTLLFQDQVGGLEILSENHWIPATPIPGTILLNVGDLLQYWAADKYPATVHRVRIPQDPKMRQTSRQSFAFFSHPDNEVTVSALDGSTKRPPVNALDHLNKRFAYSYKY